MTEPEPKRSRENGYSSDQAGVAFQLAVRNGSRQHHWRFGDMLPVPGLTPDEVAHVTANVRVKLRMAGIE
mgnify:CR=1 FL=1